MVSVWVLLVSLPASASGLELHPGHLAAHATLLERSAPRAPKRHPRRRMMVIGHDSLKDMTDSDHLAVDPSMVTQLADMKSEYLGKVGIGERADGSPLFQARVVFDTGSTNLWVASSLCTGEACESSHKDTQNFYDPQKSKTSKWNETLLSTDIDITFGTGELKGPMVIDTYRVGAMKVVDQPFAMIRKMSGTVFSSIPFEGIVGLGFPSLSFAGIQPFFDRVIEQKVLFSNEFSFYMNEDWRKPSAIMWGGVDPNLYVGDIAMFPVVQPHYWSIELHDFKLGNRSYSKVDGYPRVSKLIVDTGTTYYSGPRWFLDEILEEMPAAYCTSTDKYPDMQFVLKDAHGDLHVLRIPPDAYMLEGRDQQCQPGWMAIEVRGEYGPAIILGEVFIRRFFTVFRRGDGKVENARVGFARAKSGAMPKGASQVKDIKGVMADVAQDLYSPGTPSQLGPAEGVDLEPEISALLPSDPLESGEADSIPFDVDLSMGLPPAEGSAPEADLAPRRKHYSLPPSSATSRFVRRGAQ